MLSPIPEMPFPLLLINYFSPSVSQCIFIENVLCARHCANTKDAMLSKTRHDPCLVGVCRLVGGDPHESKDHRKCTVTALKKCYERYKVLMRACNRRMTESKDFSKEGVIGLGSAGGQRAPSKGNR